MIDGSTRLLGIVGHPLAHSLSPFLHNYVLARAGLNVRYVPFPVAPGADLGAALRGLAAAGVAGVNVTIPHKVAAAAACDVLSPEAEATGAANTIAFRGARLEGHNTDVAGFLAPLTAARVALAERECVVLGAGGAARAAAFALARAGALVTLAAREERAALETVAAVARADVGGRLRAVPWSERAAAVAGAHLVVNATPLGQAGAKVDASPLDGADVAPRAGQVFYDLVYNPPRTRFLDRARAAGATAIGGLAMLVAQGVAALELWLDLRVEPAALEDVRRRCEEQLERAAAGGRGGTAWVASGT
jgi:shikimate dehydrogenase